MYVQYRLASHPDASLADCGAGGPRVLSPTVSMAQLFPQGHDMQPDSGVRYPADYGKAERIAQQNASAVDMQLIR